MLPDTSIADGYLKIRDDAGKRKGETEDKLEAIEKLRMFEAQAKADSRGLWDTQSTKISTSYEMPNPRDFAQQWKGKPLTGEIH